MPAVVRVRISEKNHQFFPFFKVGEIMVRKYGHLILPGVFPDKITLVIDFTDEAVVQYDFQVIKIFL